MLIIVHYNNYKDEFKLTNGCVGSKAIDDEYCLSFSFKGNFQMKLSLNGKAAEYKDENGIRNFINLQEKQTYKLEVIMDQEAEENFVPKTVFVNPNDLKQEEKRQEGCSCLYGNPCADEYVCLDWKNRFEVAKKNGQR